MNWGRDRVHMLHDGRIPISERIAYWPGTHHPLCAEVVTVRGDGYTWVFDAGSGPAAAAHIRALPGRKNLIVSHFHPDHMGNWDQVEWKKLYLGDYACGKICAGTAVTEEMSFEDGAALRVFPLPSSHARGSLALEVDGQYLFLGDGIYGTMKNGERVHNQTVLLSLIRTLESSSAPYFALSHAVPFVQPRDQVLSDLKTLYARRDPRSPYIPV